MRIRRPLVFLSALAAALVLAEIALRLVPSAWLGFTYGNGRFRAPAEFQGDPTRNAPGFHDVDHAPKGTGVRRIVLLGDSYVAAESVALADTVGRRLEHYLNAAGESAFEVVVLGQPGWGQRDQLEALENHGPAIQPDCVVTLILTFNDVRDNSDELTAVACRQEPFLVRERPGWTTLSARDAPLFWIRGSRLNQLLSHRLALRRQGARNAGIPVDYLVYAAELDEPWAQAWGQTEELLAQTRDGAACLGATYAVVAASTPHGVLGAEAGVRELVRAYPAMRDRKWDLDAPDRRVEAFCAGCGIPFLALQPVFRKETVDRGRRLHWRFDGHWNVEGNDLAGQCIAGFVLGLRPASMDSTARKTVSTSMACMHQPS
jgi:hypothetical protein